MSRRASLILTLTAWLFATGSHWDIVQTFAWGKMFATYAQSMSYTDAARLTFSADNLCDVCEIVDEAKNGNNSEQSQPGTAGTQKIQLALGGIEQIAVFRPDSDRWPHHEVTLPRGWAQAPPLPPPRA